MEIKALGPHTLVVGQEGPAAKTYDISEHNEGASAVPPLEQSSGEKAVSQDSNQPRFSRLTDLIQEAEKRKQLRGKKDRRRAKMIRAYSQVRDMVNPQETIGTLVQKVA